MMNTEQFVVLTYYTLPLRSAALCRSVKRRSKSERAEAGTCAKMIAFAIAP
jgi:hypothetical protein